MNAFEGIQFFISKPDNLSVKADWDIDGEKGTKNYWNWVQLPTLYGKSGTVSFSTVEDTGVEAVLGEDAAADVYNVAGYLVKTGATADEIRALPAGIYIVKGQKIAVK